MNYNSLLIICLSVLCFEYNLNAQNYKVKEQKKQSAFAISGSTRLGLNYYNSFSKFTPLPTYTFNGNVNIKFKNWTIPVNFNIIQRSGTVGNPLNKVGFSTNFKKSLKLHFGSRNMQFSNYFMNGNTFFGTGMELKYKKFRLSSMAGYINDISLPTIISKDFFSSIKTDFHRKAFAFKIGLGTNNNYFDLILHKVQDDASKVDTIHYARPKVKENLCIGFQTGWTISKLKFFVETAGSAVNQNNTSDTINDDVAALSKVFVPRKASSYAYALKAGISLPIKRANVNLSYEKISAEFITLTNPFYQNNLDRAAASYFFPIKKLKINISGNHAYELRNSSSLSIMSFIALSHSAALNYSHSKNLAVNLTAGKNTMINSGGPHSDGFSTFFTNNKSHNLGLSMSIKQYWWSLPVQFNYIFNWNQNTSNASYSDEVRYFFVDNIDNKVRLDVRMNKVKLKISYSPGVNYYFNEFKRFNIQNQITIDKQFLDSKLNTSLQTGFIQSIIQSKSNGSSFNVSLRSNYNITKNLSAGNSIIYSIRNFVVYRKTQNFRFNLNLNYKF
jgi:hypothetical protein